MKPLLVPISIAFLILYLLADKTLVSYQEWNASQQTISRLTSDLGNKKRFLMQKQNQLSLAEERAIESNEFLQAWNQNLEDYSPSYNPLLTSLANKYDCVIVGRSQNEREVKIGTDSYATDFFDVSLVGDYRDILNLLGEFESRAGLVRVTSIEASKGIEKVKCQISYYLPKLNQID